MSLFFIVLSSLTSAAPPTEHLQQKLTALQSLKANFRQTVRDEKGVPIQRAEGRFFIKKPKRLRWETLQPFKQIILSKSDTLSIYDIELEQVIVHPLDKTIAGTPAAFLLTNENKLDEQFNVTEVKTLAASNPTFRLIPKVDNLSQTIAFIELTFSKNTLMAIHLEDKLGRQTQIDFFDTQSNPVLLDNLFELDLPKHIDIIDQRNQ